VNILFMERAINWNEKSRSNGLSGRVIIIDLEPQKGGRASGFSRYTKSGTGLRVRGNMRMMDPRGIFRSIHSIDAINEIIGTSLYIFLTRNCSLSLALPVVFKSDDRVLREPKKEGLKYNNITTTHEFTTRKRFFAASPRSDLERQSRRTGLSASASSRKSTIQVRIVLFSWIWR
jgi:hypothetical protein